LPSPSSPARADELWRHTCFEAFLRAPDGSYLEFNFAPSTQWAAYRFSGYRAGMALEPIAAPKIWTKREPARFELQVELDAGFLALASPWRLALAAVIEEIGGAKSYWALAHAPGKPDFHHLDAFAYEFAGAPLDE
jgi:hypothetical protein